MKLKHLCLIPLAAMMALPTLTYADLDITETLSCEKHGKKISFENPGEHQRAQILHKCFPKPKKPKNYIVNGKPDAVVEQSPKTAEAETKPEVPCHRGHKPERLKKYDVAHCDKCDHSRSEHRHHLKHKDRISETKNSSN